MLGLSLTVFALCALDLTAQVDPLPIQSIQFEGNVQLGDSRLKRLLRLSREGNIFASENLEIDLNIVEMAYRDLGYLKVKVGPPAIEVQTHNGMEVAAIHIPITEGPLYRVGEVNLINANALSRETLMQMCPFKKGEVYSPVKARQWQAEIEEVYHSMGYIKYQGIAREHLNETDSIVDFSLECVEGKPYSIGKITVLGDESIDPVDIKRHLLISEGGLFNPEMLTMSIRFLNRRSPYGPISHSDVDITIDEAKNMVDVTLRLNRPELKSP